MQYEQYEVHVSQRIDYSISVEAASFNDAALLVEKPALKNIEKITRALGQSCLNDHETKVTGIYVNE